jgi:hypothetical protein
MAAPWQKYASAAGPWAKYASSPTDEANQALAGTGITVSPPKAPDPVQNADENASGVYQNIGEGIKEQWDVPKMLDQAGDAVSKLADVATGNAKSQNNLKHPIDFAKRLISGVGGPSTMSTPERLARGTGNVIGGALAGSVAPEAAPAAEDMGAAAVSKVGQMKRGLVVGDELKQAASQVPSDATVATAQRSVSDIHQAAVPELTKRAGAVLDRHATQLGVDTTGRSRSQHQS